MEKYSITDLDDVFQKALKDFMREMHDWEMKNYEKSTEAFDGDSSEADVEEEMRNELLRIFQKFVLEGGRNYDRVDNLVCGSPPEYDEDSDQIDVIEASGEKIFISIKKTKGLRPTYRLSFTEINGVPMISSRDLKVNDKWQKTYV